MKFSTLVCTALVIGSSAAFAPPNAPTSSSRSALNLAVGETAPDFALKDQNGKVVKRSSIKKPLCIFFYPADGTPGCTKQATSFNEQVKSIRKEFDAEVVGILGQDVESKQKFAADLGLDFSILADENDETRKAFDVPRAAFGLLPGRVTYVLDKNGVCRKIHNDLADSASHVEVAKAALSGIKPAKGAVSFL